MPRRNREAEILGAIRAHLKTAVAGAEQITDRSLMAAAKCSRATFYKYVTAGSEIQREIDAASVKQRKNVARSGRRRSEPERIIAQLRVELAEAQAGNRHLLGRIAQIAANLKVHGLSAVEVEKVLAAPMPQPDRSVSHAGRSRRGKRHKYYRRG
jgi:hypothetical protein